MSSISSSSKLAAEMRDFGVGWATKSGLPLGVHAPMPQRWEATVRTGITGITQHEQLYKLGYWFDGALDGHFAEYSVRLGNKVATADEVVETEVTIASIGCPTASTDVILFDVHLEVEASRLHCNDQFETKILTGERHLQFEYNRSLNTVQCLAPASDGLTLWPTTDAKNKPYVPSFRPDSETGMDKYTFPGGYVLAPSGDVEYGFEAEAYDVDVTAPLYHYIL